MIANVFVRSFPPGGWVRVSPTSLIMNATFTSNVRNAAMVEVRFRGGSAVLWPPGATVFLEAVDLYDFEVNVPSGQTFLVVGYSR